MTSVPHVFQPGDFATFNGVRVEIADVNFNYRPACPCRYGCPRVQFVGGGYARTCQLTPAEVAPDSLAAQAGTNVVRLQVLETGVYRVQAENSHGGLLKYDTPDGVGDLARTYPGQSQARQVARDITILLRAGLSPRAVAFLTLNTAA